MAGITMIAVINFVGIVVLAVLIDMNHREAMKLLRAVARKQGITYEEMRGGS